MEGCHEVEDRGLALARDHAAGVEAATVAHAIDLVVDRKFGVSRAHEVGVGRVDRTPADGRLGSRHRLGEDETAEDAPVQRRLAVAAELVLARLLEGQQRKQRLRGESGSESRKVGDMAADE